MAGTEDPGPRSVSLRPSFLWGGRRKRRAHFPSSEAASRPDQFPGQTKKSISPLVLQWANFKCSCPPAPGPSEQSSCGCPAEATRGGGSELASVMSGLHTRWPEKVRGQRPCTAPLAPRSLGRSPGNLIISPPANCHPPLPSAFNKELRVTTEMGKQSD